MSGSNFNRREMLKMGAFASAATFLNFGLKADSAFAQNQTGSRIPGDKIIRIWGNENPSGPSPKARQAIVEAVASAGNRYAVAEIPVIERLIAEREGVAPESVVLGCGAGGVLAMAAVAYGLDKGEIVAADNTFSG